MEGTITDDERAAMLRAAVEQVGRDDLKAALGQAIDPSFRAPTAVVNALNALRKHRDPSAVVTRPQYRAALPYVAALVSEACLTRTIEALGEHSDDPTREQLLAALDEVRGSDSDVTIAVMLASVADGEMPASDLCFELLATDHRFGLQDRSGAATTESAPAVPPSSTAPTPEQREARRLKKQKDAEARRRKMEASRKAADQVRQARKQDRSAGPAGRPSTGDRPAAPSGGAVPTLTRRAALTPIQEEEFDREDPWVTGVVSAWVSFDITDPSQPGIDGKFRPCVVVAGSPTHLLVRAGYSEGGVKSRDWKSVPLRHWRSAGVDQPTWIDIDLLAVDRQDIEAPRGWLTPEDWNALW